MARMIVNNIYEQYIRSLPVAERLRLMALMARDLASEAPDPGQPKEHSIMELHGLGKDIWDGIDAQNYVDSLRAEWDADRSERPSDETR